MMILSNPSKNGKIHNKQPKSPKKACFKSQNLTTLQSYNLTKHASIFGNGCLMIIYIIIYIIISISSQLTETHRVRM